MYIMVGLSGLEPLTSRLSGVRSNQLSYRPILWWRRGESNSWPPACKAGALPAELRPQIWLRYFPQYFVATASHFVNVGYYVFLMLLVTPRLAKNFSPYFFLAASCTAMLGINQLHNCIKTLSSEFHILFLMCSLKTRQCKAWCYDLDISSRLTP